MNHDPLGLTWQQRLFRFYSRYRRRIAFLALVGGLLMIGNTIGRAFPRDTQARYDIGEQVTRLRVSYHCDDELVRGVEFGPLRNEIALSPVVDDDFAVSPGTYAVDFEIERRGETEHITRRLDVPAEGRVRFRLGPQ